MIAVSDLVEEYCKTCKPGEDLIEYGKCGQWCSEGGWCGHTQDFRFVDCRDFIMRERECRNKHCTDPRLSWQNYGPAILALYVSDLVRAGKLGASYFNKGHGFEDQDLWMRLYNAGLQMVRKRSWLPHQWHPSHSWKTGKNYQDMFNGYKKTICPARLVAQYCPPSRVLYHKPGGVMRVGSLDPGLMPGGRRHLLGRTAINASGLNEDAMDNSRDIQDPSVDTVCTDGKMTGNGDGEARARAQFDHAYHCGWECGGYHQWWLAPVEIMRSTIVNVPDANGAQSRWWGVVSPSSLVEFGLAHLLGDGDVWVELAGKKPLAPALEETLEHKQARMWRWYPTALPNALSSNWTKLGDGACFDPLLEEETLFRITPQWVNAGFETAKKACEANPKCAGIHFKQRKRGPPEYLLLTRLGIPNGEDEGGRACYKLRENIDDYSRRLDLFD